MGHLISMLTLSQTTAPTTSNPATTPTEVYTSVTTVTGQIRTVLVTPTADATMGRQPQNGQSKLSAGVVAGIVVALVLGLGILIGAAVWFVMKRRRRRGEGSVEGSFSAERMGGSGSGSGNTSNVVPSRQVSQLSSAGLLGRPPRIETNFYPSSNDPRSPGTTNSSNVDRRSLGTDQRLNPWALYTQDDRNSSVSLQDNQDYSRQLRVWSTFSISNCAWADIT
jgi:hypothetical protein